MVANLIGAIHDIDHHLEEVVSRRIDSKRCMKEIRDFNKKVKAAKTPVTHFTFTATKDPSFR